MATQARDSGDTLAPAGGSVTPRRRAGLTQERSPDTRRRLVRTAMRLWTERGFETGIEDTTVDEMMLFVRAQEAGEVTDQVEPMEMAQIVEALYTDCLMQWSRGRLKRLNPARQRRTSIVLAGLRPGAAFPAVSAASETTAP